MNKKNQKKIGAVSRDMQKKVTGGFATFARLI